MEFTNVSPRTALLLVDVAKTVKLYGRLKARLETLCPEILAYLVENNISPLDFARMLDPNIPDAKAERLKNPTYSFVVNAVRLARMMKREAEKCRS